MAVASWWGSLPHVARAAGPAVASITLENGTRVFSVSAPGPLKITARMAVGSRSDPPGREGLAELTGHGLPLATLPRGGDGELARAIGTVAASASVTVGPSSTELVLDGVTDARAALALAAEILVLPSFPHGPLQAERASLARWVMDEAHGATARRQEARARLVTHAWPSATPWTVLALEAEDCVDFHASAYRPDRLAIVFTGESAPDTAALETMARETIGAWVQPNVAGRHAPGERPVRRVAPVPAVLRGGESAALSLAFPVPEQGAAAAIVALRAAIAAAGPAAASLEVVGDASTAAGDLVAPPGSVVLVDGPTPDPASASAGILAALRDVSRQGKAEARIPVGDLRVPPEDLGLAFLEEQPRSGMDPAKPAVRDVAARDMARAARALWRGPRSAVAQLPETVSEAACRSAFPGAIVSPLGLPTHPAERACVLEGARWLAASVAAHGGPALLALPATTRVCQTLQSAEGQPPTPLFETRVDLNLAGWSWRQESRPYLHRGGAVVLSSSGDTGWFASDEIGTLAMDSIEVIAHRARRQREPVALLQRAVSGMAAARSEGVDDSGPVPVRRIAVADPDVGLTLLEVDADTSLLLGATYRLSLDPDHEPIVVQDEFSQIRDVNGLKLPASIASHSPSMGAVRAVDADCEWLPAEQRDLVKLRTEPSDIRRAALP